ncbi:MAG: hypothetical protein V2A65_02970 [Candidatus Omnitrophota bacterium]
MDAQYYINMYKALVNKLQESGFSGTSAFLVAPALLQELSKDRRVEEMKADREKAKEEPATAKQIAYLRILGRDVGNGTTKQQAARMIEKALQYNR